MEQVGSISEGQASPAQMEHNDSKSSEVPTNASNTRSSDRISNQVSHSESSHTNLENVIASLSIDEDIPKTMFRSLVSIFQASQAHEGRIVFDPGQGGNTWTILHGAGESETQGGRDVAALRHVRGILDQMSWTGSQLLLPAIRTMADASRDPSWRLAFGEGGILSFALAMVATNNAILDLQIQALRLIGNSCADTDENRNRVVSNHYLQMIMARMETPALSGVAVPVVYNICCDYAPAQQEAMACGLYATLVRVFENDSLGNSPALTYACRLLDYGLKECDPKRSPQNAVEVLLRVALRIDLDVDDCASLVDAAVAHLQSEDFQKHMISNDQFTTPLRVLLRTYFPQADLNASRIPSVSSMATVLREVDEEAELTRIRKSLIMTLSDISALPEFTTEHISLNTQAMDTLFKWLSATLPQLQLCACIVLGNIAQSDEVCEAMVVRLHIHKDLIRILKSSTDTQVVHSVLGFLRNLALPKENKSLIGEAGAIEALTKFLSSDSLQQVSHAAAALVRQLVIGKLANASRLLAPLSADEDSPAHSRTNLSLLLGIYDKTDELALKTEIARLIAAVLRCVQSAESINEVEKDAVLQRLYSMHHNIAEPLGMMVTQSKYPVLRSEGWFAMALMARSAAGAAAIQTTIAQVNIFTALEDTIRGTTSGPAQGAESSTDAAPASSAPISAQTSQEMRTKDRENAMILVSELLQSRDEDLMADIRRSALEDLLQAGSQVDRH